jgi:hypothetical protein
MNDRAIHTDAPHPETMCARIVWEMRRHAPFTLFGVLTGTAIMLVLLLAEVPRTVSHGLFWTVHPLHVLLSAMVTAALFRRYTHGRIIATCLIGYTGAVGIATISDSVIPFLGEWMLDLPNRGIHLGFIEKWWLVNPLAVAGIIAGYHWPRTRFPHFGHVLLSTWASLFHITMAMGDTWSIATVAVVTVFLFLAVWLPCCLSDIAYPLLFVRMNRGVEQGDD